jgi:competence protein ComFC
MKLLSALWNAFLDFLFPKPETVAELEHLSPGAILKLLPTAEDTGDKNTIALFNYADPLVRDIVWELKYRGSRVMAEKLASILMDVIMTELAERKLTENFGNDEQVLLIPLPISGKRRNERGYNQIEILCEEIKKLDTENLLKYVPGQLTKHKHTDPQTLTATKKERLENVADSMHIVHSPSVAGKSIILVDDVTTTGATFKEAKRALHNAGAKKIICLAVAH